MEPFFPYSMPLALFVGSCWLLATTGVACDICVARRWRSLWWVPVTLVLGPPAAALFVFFWSGRKRIRTEDHGRVTALRSGDTTTQPGARHQTDEALSTISVGSGLFLLVRQGAMQDAYRSRQIPTARPLIVRRATSADERAGPDELLLHDRAVSRTQHCRLQCAGEKIILEDTSTNGTFIDDLQIVRASTTVRVGSTIQVGMTELLLCDERQVFPTVVNR